MAAYFIRTRLHEPEVFIANKARDPGAFSLRQLVADEATARTSLGMVILCSVQNFGYYGIMIWLPNYLSTRFGYGLTQSAVWTGVTIAGMALAFSCSATSPTGSAAARRSLVTLLGAAVMVVVYSSLVDPTALLIGGAVMGFFVNGMLGGYGALMSELYPTSARATAQNVFFNIGRAVAGFGPLAVGAISASYGFQTAIALLSLLYVVDIVALFLLVPERRGADWSDRDCIPP